MTVAARAVKIHPADDVAVAVQALTAGDELVVEGERVVLADDVPTGHKLALRPLARGQTIVKYGFPIGAATAPIACGAWVHSHNLKTCLEGVLEYVFNITNAIDYFGPWGHLLGVDAFANSACSPYATPVTKSTRL